MKCSYNDGVFFYGFSLLILIWMTVFFALLSDGFGCVNIKAHGAFRGGIGVSFWSMESESVYPRLSALIKALCTGVIGPSQKCIRFN